MAVTYAEINHAQLIMTLTRLLVQFCYSREIVHLKLFSVAPFNVFYFNIFCCKGDVNRSKSLNVAWRPKQRFFVDYHCYGELYGAVDIFLTFSILK